MTQSRRSTGETLGILGSMLSPYNYLYGFLDAAVIEPTMRGAGMMRDAWETGELPGSALEAAEGIPINPGMLGPGGVALRSGAIKPRLDVINSSAFVDEVGDFVPQVSVGIYKYVRDRGFSHDQAQDYLKSLGKRPLPAEPDYLVFDTLTPLSQKGLDDLTSKIKATDTKFELYDAISDWAADEGLDEDVITTIFKLDPQIASQHGLTPAHMALIGDDYLTPKALAEAEKAFSKYSFPDPSTKEKLIAGKKAHQANQVEEIKRINHAITKIAEDSFVSPAAAHAALWLDPDLQASYNVPNYKSLTKSPEGPAISQLSKSVDVGDIHLSQKGHDALGEYQGAMVQQLQREGSIRPIPEQDVRAYHGTPHTFETFDPLYVEEHGFFFSPNPQVASEYAGHISQGQGFNPQVLPVRLDLSRAEKPLEYDWLGFDSSRHYDWDTMDEILTDALERGADVVKVSGLYDVGSNGIPQDQWVVLRQKGIVRSLFDDAELFDLSGIAGLLNQGVLSEETEANTR